METASMTVKRWIASEDGWPEKKVSQVEVVRASDYDALQRYVNILESQCDRETLKFCIAKRDGKPDSASESQT
jgi:hypothetical protein